MECSRAVEQLRSVEREIEIKKEMFYGFIAAHMQISQIKEAKLAATTRLTMRTHTYADRKPSYLHNNREKSEAANYNAVRRLPIFIVCVDCSGSNRSESESESECIESENDCALFSVWQPFDLSLSR